MSTSKILDIIREESIPLVAAHFSLFLSYKLPLGCCAKGSSMELLCICSSLVCESTSCNC